MRPKALDTISHRVYYSQYRPQCPPARRAQVNHDVVVDTSLDPSVYVTRVYTTLEDGAYGVGEEIPIIVVFSAPVRLRRVPPHETRESNADRNTHTHLAMQSDLPYAVFFSACTKGDVPARH